MQILSSGTRHLPKPVVEHPLVRLTTIIGGDPAIRGVERGYVAQRPVRP
jgi:hypothetical protein